MRSYFHDEVRSRSMTLGGETWVRLEACQLPLVLDIPEIILGMVCEFYEVERERVLSLSRTAELSWARQVGMSLTRLEGGRSFQEVAEFYGRKDHGTVMYAMRRVRRASDLAGGRFPEFLKVTRLVREELTRRRAGMKELARKGGLI